MIAEAERLAVEETQLRLALEEAQRRLEAEQLEESQTLRDLRLESGVDDEVALEPVAGPSNWPEAFVRGLPVCWNCQMRDQDCERVG